MIYGPHMEKQLKILQPDNQAVNKLCGTLKLSRAAASILVNRNILSPEAAIDFLNPSLKHIRSPFSVKDMDAAVSRISKAILKQEKILIFGDYDVDGITSVVLLFDFLNNAGADVSYYIPHRLREGYSIQEKHIGEVAVPEKINLIITVDCGSSDYEAVQAANRAGIDVIITDHHSITSPFPDAAAVVNPKRNDCRSGYENLAGVGVVFILLICLRKYLRNQGFWKPGLEPNLKNSCDLVALGTIADAVPLTQDNRILTHFGIERLRSNHKRPGIDELVKISKISQKKLNSEDISYRLAPRLNAPGRMEHAKHAVNILKAPNKNSAVKMARILEEYNSERKATEKVIIEEISAFLKSNPGKLDKKSLVLANSNWHGGVLGIVASRLVDQYSRPVILLSIQDGIAKGSARSIPGFDITRGLADCTDYLSGFGGHSMAAGLKLKADNLQPFRDYFETSVTKNTTSDIFNRFLPVDFELKLDSITDDLIDEIESLGPFGTGNTEPIFIAKNVRVKNSSIIGGCHRRMCLYKNSKNPENIINAIQFHCNTNHQQPRFFDQIIFKLQWNHWNGKKSPQIIIEQM